MSGRLPYHVNQNNLCNDEAAPSGIDLRMTLLPAKLRAVGFRTHMVGKWHGGARSAANLPQNRGFDTHLGFLKGGEDHFSQHSGNVVDLWKGEAPAYGLNGTYSTLIYAKAATDLIEAHDVTAPFFLYLPWHVVRLTLATAASAGCFLLFLPLAHAHSSPTTSFPPAGTYATGGPRRVLVQFNCVQQHEQAALYLQCDGLRARRRRCQRDKRTQSEGHVGEQCV